MNQILSTSMPTDNKKQKNKIRNTNPTSISSILKFFAIAMLIFGILLIGLGAYSIYEKESKQKEENLQPSISLEDKSNDTVLLKVVYGKNISKLEYRWNDEEETTVNGNNGKYIEQEIKVPTGTNTLHIVITDEDGKQIPYDKQYERESSINFEVSGNKIKITAESEKTIKNKKQYKEDYEKFIKELKSVAKKMIEDEGCIGSISELYDSKRPQLPKGAIAQAWSVAEIFRILY